MRRPFLLAVMGPTASGKTDLAESLADRFDAQLISADAFQVYRGFDIGTAKTDNRDRYRLIDIRGPAEGFGVGEFVVLAAGALVELWSQQRSAIVVGGTGLYIRALFEQYANMAGLPDKGLRDELEARIAAEGLDALAAELKSLAPEIAARIDLSNPARVRRALERLISAAPAIKFDLPPYRKIKIALERTNDELNTRIEDRLDGMLHNGWVGEVAKLRSQGVSPADPAMRGIGYSTIWRHLDGDITLPDAREAILGEMRRYAKRQRTWLRREPCLVGLRPEDGQLIGQASSLIEIK